ncbi:MAG TPA: Asd/ArgC dimerization domain-containing protein [Candidatus Polarisedimenticolaceae bacterium]|nr:Asd/ArgC dimerization domain-containing protein [Candidatus Polarisedimenticolaceae bacterium]
MRSPLSAEAGTARVALVGASTPLGIELRQALEERGVPGGRVDLYGTIREEATISEYDGEARLIQQPDVAEVARHDVVFLCETGPLAARLAVAAEPAAVVIDLAGALVDPPRPAVVHMDINPQAAHERRGVLAVPHPLSLLLAELLLPLQERLGLTQAVAVVTRPVADFGAGAIEELREQTVGLLSFAEVPTTVLGNKLAFNVVPQSRIAAESGDVEARIQYEVGQLLGWEQGRLAVRLLAVPVFYGHGLQVRVALAAGTTAAGVAEALRDVPDLEAPSDDTPATPLEVSGESRASLAEVAADGAGGFWLWLVVGEAAKRSALQAVRLASALVAL